MSEKIIELNVGGINYTTTNKTLLSESNTYFTNRYNYSCNSFDFTKDAEGRLFIDRDGNLFQFILNFLRDKKVILPNNFADTPRLRNEAEFYKLTEMVKHLENLFPISSKACIEAITNQDKMSLHSKKSTGCIVVGYRGINNQ